MISRLGSSGSDRCISVQYPTTFVGNGILPATNAAFALSSVFSSNSKPQFVGSIPSTHNPTIVLRHFSHFPQFMGSMWHTFSFVRHSRSLAHTYPIFCCLDMS